MGKRARPRVAILANGGADDVLLIPVCTVAQARRYIAESEQREGLIYFTVPVSRLARYCEVNGVIEEVDEEANIEMGWE
jgi:hypothetical protein